MANGNGRTYKRLVRGVLALMLVTLAVPVGAGRRAPETLEAHLGYGAQALSPDDYTFLQAMGFNWIKVQVVPDVRLPAPMKVLLRINVYADTTAQQIYDQLAPAFAHPGRVDAYEIGNEPNTDTEWHGAPDPAGYLAKLQLAAGYIRQSDPTATIVSGGLAPVGRIQGTCVVGGNTYQGNNCSGMDDQLYARWLFANGAAAAFDVFGYHNYGYALEPERAPDPSDPQVGPNLFVFRAAEVLHAIMAEYGLGARQIWTTEFGWLIHPDFVQPGLNCLSAQQDLWRDRLWYLQTPAQQADYLARAYAYAEANWPWMGVMLTFNLNFSESLEVDACEPMKYFSIYELDGSARPAVAALSALPKVYGDFTPILGASPLSVTLTGDPDESTGSTATTTLLSTRPTGGFLWSAALVAGSDFTPTITPTTGLAGQALAVTASPAGLTLGTHLALIRVEASQVGGAVLGTPTFITVALTVANHEILNVEPPMPLGVIAFLAPVSATHTLTQGITVVNRGRGTFTWSAALVPGGTFTPTLVTTTGAPGGFAWARVDFSAYSAATGTYTTTLRLSADHGAANSPLDVPVRLVIAPTLYDVFIPVHARMAP